MLIQTISHKNHIIEIHSDEMAPNPREDFNIPMGTMVCFHGRYNLGDKQSEYHKGDFNGWQELENAICRDHNAIYLPIYMYDHSGLTINTTGFSCSWDSGKIGFIFTDKAQVRKEWKVKNITKKIREKTENWLRGEVETYDRYLRGDVYGYVIKDNGDNDIDSCWGFYGDMDDVINQAKDIVDYRINNPKPKEPDPRQLILNL